MSELTTRRTVVLHGAAAILLGAGAMIFGKATSAAALAPSSGPARVIDPTTVRVSGAPFSACGGEMRIGLRSGPAGTQSSNTLSWSAPHDLQYFYTMSSTPSPDLPANYYAFNTRMPTTCAGDATQTSAGKLYR